MSCSKASQGSKASVKCAEYHERPAGANSNLQCINKQWSDPIPRCEPSKSYYLNDLTSTFKKN